MLYANNITELPSNLFKPLNELQLLLLNANELRCLRRDVFEGLENLNLLSLYDNNIQSISNGTFTPLKALQTLHLARNPLICDCNLLWLPEMLRDRPIETSGAKCEKPRRLVKRRLSMLQPNKFRCKAAEAQITKHADECFIDHACPEECFCHDTVVDCSARGLTSIPNELPSFTTELRLNRNRIQSIETHNGLTRLKHLEHLDLSDNQISSIEKGSFEGLKYL